MTDDYDSDDYDSDVEYNSGPFCRHWCDPSGCEEVCGFCGHQCRDHWSGEECQVEGCDCTRFVDEGDDPC